MDDMKDEGPVSAVADAWISVADGLPAPRRSEFYGERYSEAVIAVVGGEVWGALMAWDYHAEGWVQADLSDGPFPDDYEDIAEVSHWRYLPAPPALR